MNLHLLRNSKCVHLYQGMFPEGMKRQRLPQQLVAVDMLFSHMCACVYACIANVESTSNLEGVRSDVFVSDEKHMWSWSIPIVNTPYYDEIAHTHTIHIFTYAVFFFRAPIA